MRNTIRTPRHTRACFAARASSCWDFVVFVVVGGGMTMKQYCSLLEREKDRVGISLVGSFCVRFSRCQEQYISRMM